MVFKVYNNIGEVREMKKDSIVELIKMFKFHNYRDYDFRPTVEGDELIICFDDDIVESIPFTIIGETDDVEELCEILINELGGDV